MHSLRSTRSYLTRPTSDISYIDDEDKARKGGGGTATNGHYIRGAAPTAAAAAAHGMNQQQNYAKSSGQQVVEAPSSHYLKVEGGAYRVQRSVSSGSGTLAQASGHPRARSSSDAATQSVESSFTQTDESLFAPPGPGYGYGGGGPPALFAMGPPPSPVPPVYIDTGEAGGAGGGRMSVMGYTRATSPTPPQQYGHIVPSPYYHPPYFEPAYYHTYLNPMAAAAATGLPEGYQYEVVVRRPSMGPTELTVPVPNAGDLSRRPSVVSHYPFPPPGGPLFPHAPHLVPYSHPGSFDSAQGPPLTPVYNPAAGASPAPPLSPRHTTLGNPVAFPKNPNGDSHALPPMTPAAAAPGPPPDSRTITIQPSDIPKLIHETSI